MFECVLNKSLEDIEKQTNESGVLSYVNEMGVAYYSKNSKYRIVADYVSGMTDDFLMRTFQNITVPKSFGFDFGTKEYKSNN